MSFDKATYFEALKQAQPLIAPQSANSIGLLKVKDVLLPTWTTPRGEKIVDWAALVNPGLVEREYIGAYTYVWPWNPIDQVWM